ncbi:MAG: hypothetical protein ISR83_05365 [Candidatus Marinimicrobia bacterium]|nr:hypothetical protein [Candidatus Neomarinimicrobiota bacterium]
MNKYILSTLFIFSFCFCQGKWYKGNLKNIDEISLSINLKGSEEATWKKSVTSYIELTLLQNKLPVIDSKPMPKLVIDIHVIDSSIDEASSFMVDFSLYDYGLSEQKYSFAYGDSSLVKQLGTYKIYSKETLGQSTSSRVYKDIETAIRENMSLFLSQWYKDNPWK